MNITIKTTNSTTTIKVSTFTYNRFHVYINVMDYTKINRFLCLQAAVNVWLLSGHKDINSATLLENSSIHFKLISVISLACLTERAAVPKSLLLNSNSYQIKS